MITGTYNLRGAAIHGAIIRPRHLQIGTQPWGFLWFDAEVWASLDAMQSGDGPLDTLPIARLEGPDNALGIVAMLAGQARAILGSGLNVEAEDAELADAMIGATWAAMDLHLLGLPEYAGWERVGV
jgi:hypothetical protein